MTIQDFIYAQSENRLKQGGPHPASIVMFTDSGIRMARRDGDTRGRRP